MFRTMSKKVKRKFDAPHEPGGANRFLMIAVLLLLASLVALGDGCAKGPTTADKSTNTTTAVPNDSIHGANGKASEDAKPKPEPVPGKVVGSSEDITGYVTGYFEAYKKKDWKTAYELLPAANRETQTLAEFTSRRAGAEITEYQVGDPVASGDEARIMVVYSIVQYGDWASIWSFKKQKDEWLPTGLEITLTN